ncbi:MAG TPA: gliding motility-associated C-terminal domain-containing protein [Bacteroidales bacterium]|nr:gliding motility-associated C-terminal domain-containing protein [Bacteroidales bacterium]
MKNIISGLFVLLSLSVFSQENCTVPLPPVLTLVSVEHETGRVNVSWSPSPSDNIAAYIIYTYSQDAAGWMPADTVWDPAAREYSYSTNATRYMSIRFVVASYRRPLIAGRPGCPSELSNSLSTIFLQSSIDTCEAKITVRWNRYQDQPKKVTGYKILVAENNGVLTEKYQAGPESDNFTISAFTSDSQYCFAVKAVLDDGTTSGSYRTCLNTNMQDPPEWISTDYVSVNDNNQIELSFSIDPSSEIRKYVLERGNGTFQAVASLTGNGKVVYTDKTADVTKLNYYRLRAVNSCNIPVVTSDTSSNMVLTATSENGELALKWNPVNLNGQPHGYQIFINTGDGYRSYFNAGISDEYRIRLIDIIYSLSDGQACFYIKADPVPTAQGMTGESISSRACFSPGEGITVPNMFTPNNDLRNDLFKPVLAFTPAFYHFVVTDRQGKILFEANDFMEEWDGSGNDEGVYLWFLKVKTPSGKVISRTGTVTIVK